MGLSPAQLTTLRADIIADPVLNAKSLSDDGANDIMLAYNAPAAPAFNVFRTNVPIVDIRDKVTWQNFTPADAPDATVIWTNRALECQGKQFNLQLLFGTGLTFDASKINLRAGLNDATTNIPAGAGGAAVSGGWNNILPILRRLATRAEHLFAGQTSGVGVTGTDPLGATTNPALMGFEGAVTLDDVKAARAN